MNALLIIAGIVAVITLLLIFLSHHLDSDLTLHVYENIVGRKPSEVLRDQVVWITGASSGIGEQLAYQLVKAGCKLVLSARRRDELERVKEKCAAIAAKLKFSFDKDRDILVLPLDLKEFSSHQNLASQVLDHFNKIDVLINNAGQYMRMFVEKTPFHVDQEIINTNLLGAISLTKAVLPHMIDRRQGQISVVSGFSGKQARPWAAPYCACKFALLGYFESLRYEVSNRNIKILTVLPGVIATNIRKNACVDSSDADALQQTLKRSKAKAMSAERCSYLITVAMVNNFKEVWIGPGVLDLYLAQYMPSIFDLLYHK